MPATDSSSFSVLEQANGTSQGPHNRQLKLVRKCLEIQQVEAELQRTRQDYTVNIKQLQLRWKHLETGQLNIKQKLVEFNNFIKEKETKIKEGKIKIKNEKISQIEKGEQLEKLLESKKQLTQAIAVLNNLIGEQAVFPSYLSSVVEASEGQFNEVEPLLDRCSALLAANQSLTARLDRLQKVSKQQNYCRGKR